MNLLFVFLTSSNNRRGCTPQIHHGCGCASGCGIQAGKDLVNSIPEGTRHIANECLHIGATLQSPQGAQILLTI
jgi:hypothetical protein